ncbi:hypothetical protein [Paenibacillus sp. FSL R7-0179]
MKEAQASSVAAASGQTYLNFLICADEAQASGKTANTEDGFANMG